MQESGGEPYVLVVDDHPMVAESLVASVRACRAHMKVCVADSLDMALHELGALGAPALILTDLALTDASGLSVIQGLRSVAPRSPLIVVTANEDPAMRLQVQGYGVIGYMLKSTSVKALQDAIAEVLHPFADVPSPVATGEDALGRLLTRTQIVVLAELAAGRSNKEIAIRLGLSSETVTYHVKEILRRLDCRNRTQAVVRYLELIDSRQRPQRA